MNACDETLVITANIIVVIAMLLLLICYVCLGIVSTIVQDTPHKIFVGCIPNYLNEDQVRATHNGYS